MSVSSALRDLFGTEPAPAAGEAALPPAIRPAVEIIARLSAERARLRTDLARVREELRQADARRGTTGLREQLDVVRGEAAALRAELEKVRAERDALHSDLTRARAERDALRSVDRDRSRPEGGVAIQGLLERLERALHRFEGGAAPVRASESRPPEPRASAPRPSIEPEARPAREAHTSRPPAGAGGGSFLAALVRENVQLRGAAKPAPAPIAPAAAPAPTPAPTPEFDRPPTRGGLLGALVAENARLRRSATPAAPTRRPGVGDEGARSSARQRRAREEQRLTA